MYQTYEEQKNDKIDFTKMDNNNLCERCKNSKVMLTCEECSPFHNFCQKCDGIIHQLPSRMNHLRQNVYQNINSQMLFKCNYNNRSSPNIYIKQKITEEKINNLINDVNNEITKEQELDQENIIDENENLNNYNTQNIQNEEINDYNTNINIPQIISEKINDLDFIKIPMDSLDEKYKKTFTKEYILELQNIHQKEKNELLFKISSLENALDRIKISFNDQLKSIQKEQTKNDKNYIAKISQIKSGLNLKYKTMENEKDLQISLLKEELDKEKKEKNELSQILERMKKEYQILQDNSARNIDDINNELNLIKNEYDEFRHETDKIIDKLKTEYDNKINTIKEENENQKTDMNIKHKLELDNINNTINSKYEQSMQELKNENSQLKQDNTILIQKITEIENYLEKMHIEYNNASNEYNNATNDLNNEIEQKINENNELNRKNKELNETLEKIYEQLHQTSDENNRLNQEMKVLNNSVINLKKNNDALNDKYNKLQKEYNDLSVNSVNLSMEYNNKIKSLNFIQDRNEMLERENGYLKNQLDKCINPFEQ